MKTITQPKIQKGIAIPPKCQRKQSTSIYPFDIMKIGDSFLMKGDKNKSIRLRKIVLASAVNWSKRNSKKHKFTTRAVKDGVRIWRIK